VSGDPLEGRVWRFGETEPNSALFVDTVLPGGARSIWSVIGQNVGEDRGVRPPIPPEDFHLAVVEAEPGNGSHLHTHTTAEVFVALSGRWALPYAATADGEVSEVILEPWDVCSVPAGVWRGQADRHCKGGRLPGPVRTEKAENFAALNCKGNVVNGGERTVSLREVLDLDHRVVSARKGL